MSDPEKPLIYIETTIPSYFVGRQSQHITLLYHQFQTREWWEKHRHEFRTVVSPEVIVEISRGDPGMAAHRLAAVEGIEEILTNQSVFLRKAASCLPKQPPTSCTSLSPLLTPATSC